MSYVEYVGLSLSYGLSLNAVLFWSTYMSCLVENRMVSVERIKQFITIPTEAPWVVEDTCPPPGWPTHGNVHLKDLQVIDCFVIFNSCWLVNSTSPDYYQGFEIFVTESPAEMGEKD